MMHNRLTEATQPERRSRRYVRRVTFDTLGSLMVIVFGSVATDGNLQH